MKKALLALFTVLYMHAAYGQAGYVGVNFDVNSTLGTRHTMALGLHGEVELGASDWYLNWDFALGENVTSDFYGRANVCMLLYGQPGYWNAAVTGGKPLAGLLGAIIFPVACPVGISNYFYTSRKQNFRLGFYLNPLQLDYWDAKNPISSWSVHGGMKMLYNWHGNSNIYLKVGGIGLNNTMHYKNASAENGVLLNVSIGTLFGID